MSSKETLDKAYGHIPKEIANPFTHDWIQPVRGIKFYWLKLKRFFTR